MQKPAPAVTGDSAASGTSPESAEDPYLARIEEELRRREREGR